MIDAFEELLEGLGKAFHLSLTTDRNHACSIQIEDHLTIQLELDNSQENLFFFTKLIEIPPGKFRENVFRETLKANSLPDPRVGIFGYLAATNQIILYQRYPLKILNGERLAGLFGAFLEFGDIWRKAIASGQASPSPGQLK